MSTYEDNYHTEMNDEYNAQFGDPRRCKFHPHVATSTGDGFHDFGCHVCEGESDMADWEFEQAAEEARRKGLSTEERDAEDAEHAKVLAELHAADTKREAEYAAKYGEQQPF